MLRQRSPRPMLLALIAMVLVASTPTPVADAADAARVAYSGSRTRAVVALTFDDGWGTANCAKVVDILEATHTPATFMPNATWVRAAPKFWTRVARLGFPIANHTTHHYDMTKLSYRDQLGEIKSDRRIIENITGKPMTRVMRPPYGAYNSTTLRAAGAAGFPLVLLWDTSFADSSRKADGSLRPFKAYFRAATKGTNGSVILGHCGSPVDYVILRDVIASYRARGFRFVTVPQMFGLPDARPMTFK